jgi:hypothetical protein
MLAGGMTIAAPSMMPQAAAAGQLFVSAENANFNNYFAGIQVVEVIVKDPKATEVDEKQQEPTVKVDEHLLRLAQGADGYWYAYIGDSTNIKAAWDANNSPTGGSDNNIHFGLYVGSPGQTGEPVLDTSSDVNTFYQASSIVANAPTLSFVTEAGARSTASSSTVGQVGILAADWPIIQTFDFTIETFEIKLEQPGADEIVVLTHDNDDIDDFAGVTLDRNAATNNAHVHLTITDQALNIDPTSEDVVLFNVTPGSEGVSFKASSDYTSTSYKAFDNSFDDNGKLIIDYDANSAGTDVLTDATSLDDETADKYLIFWETAENSGVFVNTDDDDASNLKVSASGIRGTTATIDYNDSAQSFVIAHDFATIDMDVASVGDEWNSGEEMTVVLYDQDLNLNTGSDEDLTVKGGTLVPSLQIGSPLSLKANAVVYDTSSHTATITDMDGTSGGDAGVTAFSKIATVDTSSQTFDTTDTSFVVNTKITGTEWAAFVALGGVEYINFDVQNLTSDVTNVKVGTSFNDATCVTDAAVDHNNAGSSAGKEYAQITPIADVCDGSSDEIFVTFTTTDLKQDTAAEFVIDFFSFGASTNNAIYRIEAEETGDNTATFEGSIEFVMLNQINSDTDSETITYGAVNPIQDDIDIIINLDYTDEDSPRVNYLDLGADGVSTQIADQEEAPTHSGSADLDMDNYKIADTVVVTISDQDLNVDSELIDVYITQSDSKVGDGSHSGSGDHIMDITFDDNLWTDLDDQNFTIVETEPASGIFVGSFQIPATYSSTASSVTNAGATGTDIEVNYQDFRDGSGNTIEVGDVASVRANTGSVAFDRSVYPVPFDSDDFSEHATADDTDDLAAGPVQTHIRITDADLDISAVGEDSVLSSVLVVKITRGALTTADLMPSTAVSVLEVSPDSGVFEYDLEIPSLLTWSDSTTTKVNQGDIITVTYTDAQDASGKEQTVTDSSSFDLRNGVLQSDKSVYLIGSDMILTLIEPDLDLDNDETESYTLNLIEWDSDAAETVLGDGVSGAAAGNAAAFDPEPSAFRETGDSTGIFQVVIEIPDSLSGSTLDRGEKIDLEYTDWGPAGADYVGQEDEDIGLTVYTSNFGATVELDQKVYTWTDKVYITIVAPDHNFDSGLVDEIGNTSDDPIKVSTRSAELDEYKLVESGADTGIFIGEVTLTGFPHDSDGDATNDVTTAKSATSGSGPTEGKLGTTDDDGLTVSFEFSEDETVVGSALIRWNIGEVQWLEASYPASGTGVIRVIDADMNLDPESVDNFKVDAWSDSDAGGIDLTITETNEATGIFEGTVFFTTTNESSGHRLRVAEGDTVTAEYEDNTLPDPYTTSDELNITGTALIGTVVPPLEKAPAANLRVVDAFGNSLTAVSVDQQVQLTADLSNGADNEQAFAYLVQVQDESGVTVSLAWITGSLSGGQSFSPALSWIPTESGSYTATAFVWESVDNPTALSPTVSTTITVQ